MQPCHVLNAGNQEALEASAKAADQAKGRNNFYKTKFAGLVSGFHIADMVVDAAATTMKAMPSDDPQIEVKWRQVQPSAIPPPVLEQVIAPPVCGRELDAERSHLPGARTICSHLPGRAHELAFVPRRSLAS
jgi:hypothetical protein